MKSFWLAALVSLLTLGMSGSVLATGEGDRHDNDQGRGHDQHQGQGNGHHHDDDDDDDHSNYECGPKCTESTQIVLKGRIPCICDISLPSATDIRLFRSRQLARGGSIDDVEVGNFSASCNTGSVYLKIASANGALKNIDVENTYINYDVDVGGIDVFKADTGGTEKSFVWMFDEGGVAVNSATMLKVKNLGAVNGKTAGRYRDVLTLTVSGMPL
ncbi:hypothetical protein AB4525_16090 [Vibrio breoganii]|uniref:hypothetical protein n=1 Tax=Vibrio breoganii TaxID=553239 RepID=UPI000C858217|nr:hypothetical protein [Vibrio breoganii]PMO33984.1 hypothetical protein BCT12_01235 [Vibrio breoganii]PMO55214.1 hypothetical protein BCT07_15800 [Vibrio breoganii]